METTNLSVIPIDAKIFWLEFREKLESNEPETNRSILTSFVKQWLLPLDAKAVVFSINQHIMLKIKCSEKCSNHQHILSVTEKQPFYKYSTNIRL